jgi:CHAD domain-containing protein
LRIQVKRVRYMRELCESLRIDVRSRWQASMIVQMQDALGEVTDITVLQEKAGKYASRHGHWRKQAQGLRRHLGARQQALRSRALLSIRRPSAARARAAQPRLRRSGGSTD